MYRCHICKYSNLIREAISKKTTEIRAIPRQGEGQGPTKILWSTFKFGAPWVPRLQGGHTK